MKIQEIREMSVEELGNKVVELKQELFNLRLQKSMHKLENTAKIGEVRKSIAQKEKLNLDIVNIRKAKSYLDWL